MYNQASIYKGGGVYNLGDGASTKLPANTFRFLFSKSDYDPTVAGVASGGTWQKVDTAAANVWDWTLNDSTIGTQFSNAFQDPDNLVSIIAAGTLSWTTIYQTFNNCTSLIYVCDLNTPDVTSLNGSFFGCTRLKVTPKINTSKVTIFYSCFSGCTGLKKIGPFDTRRASNVSAMFSGCVNVEEGALALYQQMSTQTTPPSLVTNCFLNCGKDTETGAAELAQIPASWGGTAPESLNMGAPQNLTEPLSTSVVDGDDSLTK